MTQKINLELDKDEVEFLETLVSSMRNQTNNNKVYNLYKKLEESRLKMVV